MNAVAIADVIRRVAETQADNFRAAIDDVRKECNERMEKEVAALKAKHAQEIEGLRTAFSAETKALEELLVEERSKSSELFASQSKSVDELVAKAAEHDEQMSGIRASLDDREPVIKGLIDQVSSLNSGVESARKSAEVSEKTSTQVVKLEADFTEFVEQANAVRENLDAKAAEIEALVKSIPEPQEIPELPKELAELPALFAEVVEKMAALEERASGFMHFKGMWDEEGEYKQGATVACKNSLWVALKDNPEGSPGEPNSGWQMCIKSGKLTTPYEHR